MKLRTFFGNEFSLSRVHSEINLLWSSLIFFEELDLEGYRPMSKFHLPFVILLMLHQNRIWSLSGHFCVAGGQPFISTSTTILYFSFVYLCVARGNHFQLQQMTHHCWANSHFYLEGGANDPTVIENDFNFQFSFTRTSIRSLFFLDI